ncbi:MAG: peptidoglycan editing factor PgeF [Oscillospiraceae bacterium]|nr:peptidoglycan editing factor PgeF [Oscillospiraceae bacterium]
MSVILDSSHPVPHLSSTLLTAAGGIAHGFSTRLGGVSSAPFDSLDLGYNRGDDPARVAENYRRFCAAIGADHDRVIKSRQIHTANIHVVTEADLGVALCEPAPYEADGLVTNVPGLCLTVFTADCVPVLLYDPVARCVAAVHSGWRSTAMAIVPKAVQVMADRFGSRQENIIAAIGPAIGGCCFQTQKEVPDAMLETYGSAAAPFIRPDGPGHFRVDLRGIIAGSLHNAGLTGNHIDISDHCTACRPDLFWSHRLVGNARGSMAAMIQLL